MAITRLGPNQDITAAKIAGTINFKNLIINGDMSIAQRGTSHSYNGNSAYNLDRFNIDNTSGAVGDITVTQESDAPSNTGLTKSLKITPDATETQTGGMNTVLTQSLEGYTVAPLQHGQSNPPQATLSFWVKSNKTGTYSVQIKEEGIVDEQYLLFAYTINSSNTWERKTFTWTGNSTHSLNYDNSEQFRIVWTLACGPDDKTSATTTWTTSTSFKAVTDQVNFLDNTANEWYITGVQLEVGTSASDFEFIPYDVNLQRCQRYYYAHEDNVARVGRQLSNTECGYDLPFPNTMRTTPTVTYNSPSSDLVQVNGNNQSPTGYDSARSTFGTKSAFLALDFPSNGAGNNICCKVILSHSAVSKKEFDAEL